MRLRAGLRLGPYEVLAVLGAGGMGEVYRARDTRLGREVALRSSPMGLRSTPSAFNASSRRPASPAPDIPSPSVLRQYARQIGADLGLFDYVMAKGLGAPEREQLQQARAVGVRPGSLVIDGEVHSGFEPPHLLRAAIDRALARRSPPAR